MEKSDHGLTDQRSYPVCPDRSDERALLADNGMVEGYWIQL